MGRDIVYFRCHRCLHCCTDVICLPTPWDVLRIFKTSGLSPYKFVEFLGPDEITEVEKNDPTWLDCNGQRYLMALWRDPKKGCFFLDRKARHCTIYPARPILCRLFPFKVHESKEGEFRRFSLHQDVECPRYRDGIVETRPLRELYTEDSRHQEDYRAMVRVFNRRRYVGKKPQDFIGMFYEERVGAPLDWLGLSCESR